MLEPIAKSLKPTGATSASSSEYVYGTQAYAERIAANLNNDQGDLDGKDGYDCPLCHNKGVYYRAKEVYPETWLEVADDCKCRAIRRSIRYMERSGLKETIKEHTFDSFVVSESWQKSLKDAAEKYAKCPYGWFFVGGQSGAGKTHICTAICRQLLLDGWEVRYMRWRDDATKLKSKVKDAEQYEQLIDQYKKLPVLYIDDLFKTGKQDGYSQKPTAADINLAFEILNYRCGNPKLFTIISSECTISDILDIDEAIGGRIKSKAGNNVFDLDADRGKNYRLKELVGDNEA